MEPNTARPNADALDFRPQATYRIALSGVFLAVPFALHHVLERDAALGLLSVAFVLVLAANALHSRHSRQATLLPALTLMPVIMLFTSVATLQLQEIGLLWCFPAILTIYCTVPERWAIGGNLALLAIQIPILWHVIDPEIATRGVATLLAASLFTGILVRVISRQQLHLNQAIVTDYLTGCLNRVTLDERVHEAVRDARANDRPAALFALDIDHFKRINDELGHAAGDRVLRHVGDRLLEQRHPGEHVFRTGGEEFLWLSPGVDAQQAGRRADALRRAIAQSHPLGDRHVTASVGVALLAPHDTPEGWTGRADAALYDAKGSGRDRFAVAA